jgi:hypothetical protein
VPGAGMPPVWVTVIGTIPSTSVEMNGRAPCKPTAFGDLGGNTERYAGVRAKIA